MENKKNFKYLDTEKENENVQKIFKVHKVFFILLLPLLLIIILIIGKNSMESRGIYIFVLIILFWILELLPPPVISFFPIILFPLFGISDVYKISRNYMKTTTVTCLGGFLFALGIQHCNLHKRIALKVLSAMNKGIHWMMLGCMLVTMFISMWITNTMATTMMMPISDALIEELYRSKKTVQQENIHKDNIENGNRMMKENSSENEQFERIIYTDDYYQEEEKYVKQEKFDGTKEDIEVEQDDSENHETKKDRETTEKNQDVKIEVIPTDVSENVNIQNEIKEDIQELKIEIKTNEINQQDVDIDESFIRIRKALLFGICFSSSCGGTGTLIGTSTNFAYKENLEYEFPDSSEVTFESWMLYNVPPMIMFVISIWIYLLLVVMKYKKSSREEEIIIQNTIIKKYKELSPMTFHEFAVLSLFICLVVIWIFREPYFLPGWLEIIQRKQTNFKIGNTTPTILLSLFLFLIPTDPRKVNSPPLLSWTQAHKKIPWGVPFILGGAFALADGFQDSGLNKMLQNQLTVLSNVPSVVNMMIFCLIAALLTQIMSNIAANTILLPVVNKMALIFKTNPLFFSIPVTVSCSFSFCMPIGTPSNAIVYDALHITHIEMMKPGIAIMFICLIIEYIMINSWGRVFFYFSQLPDWAKGLQDV